MTWEIGLVIGLVAIFAAMLAGAVMAQLHNNRPPCFASNPGPIDMGYLKCHECDEREECLR